MCVCLFIQTQTSNLIQTNTIHHGRLSFGGQSDYSQFVRLTRVTPWSRPWARWLGTRSIPHGRAPNTVRTGRRRLRSLRKPCVTAVPGNSCKQADPAQECYPTFAGLFDPLISMHHAGFAKDTQHATSCCRRSMAESGLRFDSRCRLVVTKRLVCCGASVDSSQPL